MSRQYSDNDEFRSILSWGRRRLQELSIDGSFSDIENFAARLRCFESLGFSIIDVGWLNERLSDTHYIFKAISTASDSNMARDHEVALLRILEEIYEFHKINDLLTLDATIQIDHQWKIPVSRTETGDDT